MRTDFDVLLAASPNDRRDAFIGASQRLGAATQNIEKDFLVCWTIGHLQSGPTISQSAALLDSAYHPVWLAKLPKAAFR